MELYIIITAVVICIVLLAIITWLDHRANVEEAQMQLDLDTLSDERDQLARDNNKLKETLKAWSEWHHVFTNADEHSTVPFPPVDETRGVLAAEIDNRNFYEYPNTDLPKGPQTDEERTDSDPETD